MLKSFYTSLHYAIDNIWSNFFHTLLSVIGITIGVSALIVILSMIDGLEKYAEDQISSTTAIKIVEISSRTAVELDGISIRKDEPVILTEQNHVDLISKLDVPHTSFRVSQMGGQVSVNDEDVGALIYFSDAGYANKYELEHGTQLYGTETNGNRHIAVVSKLFAERISVVVGGIGVMNVLLISVTQRTKEIGVRKAVGSSKRDIYVQFLSESMVVSLFGTLVGVIFGILMSLAVAHIVHRIIEIPFNPSFSLITISIITAAALQEAITKVGPANENTQLTKDAAMATGAFPIGLQARKITRDAAYLNKNPWFDYITKTAGLPYNFKIWRENWPKVMSNVIAACVNHMKCSTSTTVIMFSTATNLKSISILVRLPTLMG